MATLFNTLGIGYSGLNTAQVGINTTGQNVSNAETDGYTRKRVIQSAATPLSLAPGNVGNGVEIQNIERIFDDFVFRKYTSTYSDKENSDFMKKTLDELSTYFPEINDVGVKADLKEFYNLWQRFADNPSNNSVKVALAEQTSSLTDHIQSLHDQVYGIQKKLNDELKINIDEVNRLAEQIANVNKEIDRAEAGGGYTANDLRDKRSVLERDLSRLVGAKVSVETLNTDIKIDPAKTKATGSYNLHINGFNLVDGATFHPLVVDDSKSSDGFYEVYYKRQDAVLVPMDQEIKGGKVGAILDLRGARIDTTSGMPTDGVIQNTYSQLDAFAKTLISSTNNIYANVGVKSLTSNPLGIDVKKTPLVDAGLGIKEGSFFVKVYDVDGNVVAKREITIDSATVLSQGDAANSPVKNSIEYQISLKKNDPTDSSAHDHQDDNSDNNALNDIDDLLQVSFSTNTNNKESFSITLQSGFESLGYRVAIEDNLQTEQLGSGTNFAGGLGLNRFFDGTDASDITLNTRLKSDPTQISAGASEVVGDNGVALDMVQHQFEKFDFTINQETFNDTAYGFFDFISSNVGVQSAKVSTYNDTITAQFNAVEQEYDSITKVSIDEEMTNLIRYQTAYGASAKVITTVDQMLNTLLGIKQ